VKRAQKSVEGSKKCIGLKKVKRCVCACVCVGGGKRAPCEWGEEGAVRVCVCVCVCVR